MKYLYNYICEIHGTFEAWSEPEERKNFKECPECNAVSNYVISTPTIKLPGWCDTFPSASLKWEERHIKAGQQQPQSE